MARRLLLIVGLILLVHLVRRLGPAEILAVLARIGWGFVPVTLLYAAHQAVRAAALTHVAPRPGSVSYADALAVRVSGEAIQFLTSTGPFVAEPSKAVLLTRRGLSGAEAFATTLGEYLTYTFVSTLMLGGATAALLVYFPLQAGLRRTAAGLLAGSVLFLVVGLLAIARRVHLIGAAVGWLSRLPLVVGGRRAPVDAARLRAGEDALISVLRDRPRRLALVIVLETIAHAILVLELWWILRASGITSQMTDALLLESAGKFTALAFFFVPAQVGAAEGVNAVLFGAVGLTSAAGVGVALARRIRSALTAAAGLSTLWILTRRRGE